MAVRRAFQIGVNVPLRLRAMALGKDGNTINIVILVEWQSVVRQIAKENPFFEIVVERY